MTYGELREGDVLDAKPRDLFLVVEGSDHAAGYMAYLRVLDLSTGKPYSMQVHPDDEVPFPVLREGEWR